MQNATLVTLPTVTYEDKNWCFDARLRQIRNIENPHEYRDLDSFEVVYFNELVQGIVRIVWKDEGIDSEGRLFGPAYSENAAGVMVRNYGWITLKKAVEVAEALGADLETV